MSNQNYFGWDLVNMSRIFTTRRACSIITRDVRSAGEHAARPGVSDLYADASVYRANMVAGMFFSYSIRC